MILKQLHIFYLLTGGGELVVGDQIFGRNTFVAQSYSKRICKLYVTNGSQTIPLSMRASQFVMENLRMPKCFYLCIAPHEALQKCYTRYRSVLMCIVTPCIIVYIKSVYNM